MPAGCNGRACGRFLWPTSPAGGVDRGRSGTSAVGYPGHPADRRIRVQAGHFIGTDDLLRLPVSLYRPAYRGDRYYGEGDQERPSVN